MLQNLTVRALSTFLNITDSIENARGSSRPDFAVFLTLVLPFRTNLGKQRLAWFLEFYGIFLINSSIPPPVTVKSDTKRIHLPCTH